MADTETTSPLKTACAPTSKTPSARDQQRIDTLRIALGAFHNEEIAHRQGTSCMGRR
jgi:hypothetical protein